MEHLSNGTLYSFLPDVLEGLVCKIHSVLLMYLDVHSISWL